MAAGLQGWKSWAGAAIQTKGLAAMTRTGAADGEMIEFCMLFEGGDQLATLDFNSDVLIDTCNSNIWELKARRSGV